MVSKNVTSNGTHAECKASMQIQHAQQYNEVANETLRYNATGNLSSVRLHFKFAGTSAAFSSGSVAVNKLLKSGASLRSIGWLKNGAGVSVFNFSHSSKEGTTLTLSQPQSFSFTAKHSLCLIFASFFFADACQTVNIK